MQFVVLELDGEVEHVAHFKAFRCPVHTEFTKLRNVPISRSKIRCVDRLKDGLDKDIAIEDSYCVDPRN
jgi:hypothetical protein